MYWLKIVDVLRTVSVFLKKNFWLVVGLILLVLGYMLGRKEQGQAKWYETQKKIDQIQQEAELRKEEVRAEHTEKVEAVEEEHEEALFELAEEAEEENEELRNDPTELTTRLGDLLNRNRADADDSSGD